ncbi:MAG: tRNA pseudouridine(13) synthase TruD, partial [Pseudoxanthomonas sp.]|nr:tRNA pseudouridine(13) synthase TruD [Pseudoxanthomonas sp.]
DADSLRLCFSLPPGSYATALLLELGEVTDSASSRGRSSDSGLAG